MTVEMTLRCLGRKLAFPKTRLLAKSRSSIARSCASAGASMEAGAGCLAPAAGGAGVGGGGAAAAHTQLSLLMPAGALHRMGGACCLVQGQATWLCACQSGPKLLHAWESHARTYAERFEEACDAPVTFSRALGMLTSLQGRHLADISGALGVLTSLEQHGPSGFISLLDTR